MTERSSIKELFREKISCLRFLPIRNIFYDISLSHEQTNEFVLVLISRKVLQSVFNAWVYSSSDTINSSQVLSTALKCLTKVNLKNWASCDYVLPRLENCLRFSLRVMPT